MQPKSHNIDCKHKNWIAAGYPENMYGKEYVRVQSLYDVFCTDCKNFVNLLTGEIINNKGLVVDRPWEKAKTMEHSFEIKCGKCGGTAIDIKIKGAITFSRKQGADVRIKFVCLSCGHEHVITITYRDTKIDK